MFGMSNMVFLFPTLGALMALSPSIVSFRCLFANDWRAFPPAFIEGTPFWDSLATARFPIVKWVQACVKQGRNALLSQTLRPESHTSQSLRYEPTSRPAGTHEGLQGYSCLGVVHGCQTRWLPQQRGCDPN